MKFRIQVTDARATYWWEDYDKPNVTDEDSAKSAGQAIIDYFNSTLRTGERPRTLVSVEFGTGKARRNLVTEIRGTRMFDRMKCKTCGVTGKRYGFTSVTIDSQFKAKKYLTCDWLKDAIDREYHQKAAVVE